MEAQLSGLAGACGGLGSLRGLGGRGCARRELRGGSREEGAERSSGVGCVGVFWALFQAHSRPFPCWRKPIFDQLVETADSRRVFCIVACFTSSPPSFDHFVQRHGQKEEQQNTRSGNDAAKGAHVRIFSLSHKEPLKPVSLALVWLRRNGSTAPAVKASHSLPA